MAKAVSTSIDYISFENLEALNFAGNFVRGSCREDLSIECRGIRIQNLTATAHSCDYDNSRGRQCPGTGVKAAAIVTKWWGPWNNVEVLDSTFDMQTDPSDAEYWVPIPYGHGWIGLAGQCMQHIAFVNNKCKNCATAFTCHPWAAANWCHQRPPDDILIESNEAVWTVQNQWNGPDFYSTQPGGTKGSEQAYCGSVTVRNNFAKLPSGIYQEYVISIAGGNDAGPVRGTYIIENNTFMGAQDAVIKLQKTQTYMPQSFVVRNNIFGADGADFVSADYKPSSWLSDHNVFTGKHDTSPYYWNGTSYSTLADWRSVTNGDANSKECTPSFIGGSSNDLHLDPTDTCARDSGSTIASFDRDYDGDPRPIGAAWDIGADEAQEASTPVLRSVAPLP
jgi:hypothetical protein